LYADGANQASTRKISWASPAPKADGTMRVWLPTGSIDSQNGSRGWPDPGPIVESGPLRIFCNVPDDSCERFAVSDKVIEILVLPQMAVAAQREVCFVRGVGFPGVKNRRERAGSDRRKYSMDVVWHYARGVEAIAMIVEVNYGFEDDLRDAGIHHERVAAPRVEGTLGLAKELAEIRKISLRGGPGALSRCSSATLTLHLIDEVVRERIGEAERDEIGGVVLFPVGKIASGTDGGGQWHSGLLIILLVYSTYTHELYCGSARGRFTFSAGFQVVCSSRRRDGGVTNGSFI